MAARALQRPVFITMHGLETWVLGQRRRGALMAWALQQCTGLICVSHSLREVALAHGVQPEKVRVIRNTAGRDLFHIRPQAEARQQLGIESDAQLLVSVARFDYEKGHHVLLPAFQRLREWVPNARLVLIGDRAKHEPKYLDRIRAMVAELGLSDSVLLPGPQPPGSVAAWLNAADLFVLATYHEACCCAILEAMACGLPVVTTPVGDNALLVAPPRRGFLVPVENVAALVEAMHKALTTTWDRGQIARFGADYGWEEVAEQVLSFYRERLQASKP
jgi:glycosyltransferase involved in cell wall biosynthesis